MDTPFARPLTEADIPAAAAISATATEPWSESGLRETLATQVGRLFVAEQDGALCGLAVFQYVCEEASLESLTVPPTLRRRGIAEALLRAALAALRSEGAVECFLEARTQNTPALELYRKLGFAPIGLRPGFYKNPPDDALLMALQMGALL